MVVTAGRDRPFFFDNTCFEVHREFDKESRRGSPMSKKLTPEEVDEMFRMDREARIAFYSSAMANFPPQQKKYASAKAFSADMNAFAEAAADEALERLHEWEDSWEPADLDDPDDDDEEEEEEEEEEEDDDADERPRRRRA
jgi:hypothetical protein